MSKKNTFVFMKFTYYKRVVEGITTELHLHEDRNEYIVAKKYPESGNNDIYNKNEFIQLETCDDWLDEGIRSGIFDTKPIPQQA